MIETIKMMEQTIDKLEDQLNNSQYDEAFVQLNSLKVCVGIIKDKIESLLKN